MVESQAKESATFTSSDAAAFLTEAPVAKASFDKRGISSSDLSQSNLSSSLEQISDTMGSVMQGELPSNREINQFLDSAELKLKQTGNLNDQGKRLVSDLQTIVRASKNLLRSLNKDDRFQKFVKEAADFTKDLSDTTDYAARRLQRTSYDALEEGKEMIYNLKEALFFIARSGEFRQLVDDFTDLFNNIAGQFNRHANRLKEAAKKDINREDTNASKTKSTMQDVKEEVKNTELLDQQDRDKITRRFESLLSQLSRNPEYNKAVNNLFNIYDYFSRRMEQLAKDPNMQIQKNENFDAMINDAQYIIGQLFGKDNWESFTTDFWKLVTDIKNDKQAYNFFQDFRQFVNESMKNPDRFNSESERKKASAMIDRAYALMDRTSNKYGDRFTELFDYWYDMFDYAASQTEDLTDAINKFARDLITDSQGRPDIYVTQESLNLLKQLVVPLIQDTLANIPLPKLEGSNDEYDYWVDNITLDGRHILPDRFEFRSVTDVVLDVNSPENKASTQVWMKVKSIDMDFKSARFYYLRKSFPSIEDNGIADVSVRGMKFGLIWSIVSKTDMPITMNLKDVIVDMDSLDIDIVRSDHRLLDDIGTTFFSGFIKNKVCSALVESIRDTLEPFNIQMNDYFRQQKQLIDENLSGDALMQTADQKLKEFYGKKTISEKISEKGREWKDKAEEKYDELKDKAEEKYDEFNQWFDEKFDFASMKKK